MSKTSSTTWIFPQQYSFKTLNHPLPRHLQKLSPPIQQLLLQRGIDTEEKARLFFSEGLENLHDPFLMYQMSKACDRLTQAVENEERILFYGDYDTDGVTAVALMLLFFNEAYPNVTYYIPDRYQEGYGLSERGMAYAKKEKCSLVILLDCGIQEHENIQKLHAENIDVIVCDHHLPSEKKLEAFAVLNPKQTACAYPFKELSGCGIGFKLLQAFCLKNEIPEDALWHWVGLVGISIAADIVPVLDENRILLKEGLRRLTTHLPTIGIQKLFVQAGIKNTTNTPLEVQDLVFKIAPRINAAGRIAHANIALQLLITNNETLAQQLSMDIEKKNLLRKKYDQACSSEAFELLEAETEEKRTTVLFSSKWHKGVLGIVASRCIEKKHRPTVILTQNDDGTLSGSARSIEGVDLYELLKTCATYLDSFGGHSAAAGLHLKAENLANFIIAFEKSMVEKYDSVTLQPHIKVDAEITLNDLTTVFYEQLQRLAPFGPAHRRPIFCIRNLTLATPIRILKGKHLKLQVKHPHSYRYFDAIAFNKADEMSLFENGELFALCFSLSENTFQDKRILQLEVKEIQLDKK